MLKNKEIRLLIIAEITIVIFFILIVNINNLDILYLIVITVFILIIDFIFFLFLFKEYLMLRKLSSYMNNILNNDYSLDIRDYDEGIISNLKNDIYKMTVKLKENSESNEKDKKYLEEVLSDISHQLKTPLTSMHVINDILIENDVDNNTRIDFLIKNRNQLDRIEWLISSLLKMSRLDSGSERLVLKKVKLSQLINKIVEPISINIELKKQKLIIDITDDVYLNIDLNWTREALLNILKNAYEHTKENGLITIRTEDNPIYIEIRIVDNGEGISKKDLPHIFERFYKGSTNKESIGIGLNMAKKIINLQQGDIKVLSGDSGTTFIIRFYKNSL